MKRFLNDVFKHITDRLSSGAVPPKHSAVPAKIQEFKTKAECGDAEAQYRLGAYFWDDDSGHDPAEAVKWWRKAAKQNHVKAQIQLGNSYEVGVGVPENKVKAMKWWRKAAEQNTGLVLFDGEAEFSLGNAYAKGDGVAKDMSKAVKWWRKVAEQNPKHVLHSTQAQFSLGSAYAKGEGVPEDFVEAVKWLYKAAAQNHAEAQYHLGCCYYNGQGVGRDYAEAYAWFSLAAKTDSDAAKSRDLLEKEFTPEQLTNARKRTKELQSQTDAKLKKNTPSENGTNSPVIAQAEVGQSNERKPLPTTLKEIKELEKAGVKWEEIDFSQIEKEAEEFNTIFEAGFQHGLSKATSQKVCRYCGRPFSGGNICNDSPHGKCEMA